MLQEIRNKLFCKSLCKWKLAREWTIRTITLSTHSVAKIIYDIMPRDEILKVTAAWPHASQSPQLLLFSPHLHPQRKAGPKTNSLQQFTIRTLFRSINRHSCFSYNVFWVLDMLRAQDDVFAHDWILRGLLLGHFVGLKHTIAQALWSRPVHGLVGKEGQFGSLCWDFSFI